jgi:hypothetical protein
MKVEKCIVCGCTDSNCSECVAVQGEPCHWVVPGVCSRCASELLTNVWHHLRRAQILTKNELAAFKALQGICD